MDLLFLQYSNIVNDEICFMRSKTARTAKHNKEIHATITPEMWNIIHKWGIHNIPLKRISLNMPKGLKMHLKKIRLVRRIVTKCNRRLKK